MNIKNLLREDDAVSPVIGVILMVAITVILAAVIGTFVLGLGDQVQSSAPNANFQFEYGTTQASDGTNTYDYNTVTISHNGGQDVDPDNVQVLIDGNVGFDITTSGTPPTVSSSSETFSGSTTLSTGASDRVVAYEDGTDLNSNDPAPSADQTFSNAGALTGGEEVRVVWTSPNGDSSNTIGSSTVPN